MVTRASGVLSAWFYVVFKELTGREHWHFGRREHHFIPSLGIAALTGLPFPTLKGTETD